MASSALHPPLAIRCGPVTVTFTWSGDRWSHRVTVQGVGEWTSVEGPRPADADDRWPASPVLVELSQIATAHGPAILGVGLAGRSHFSASLGPDPSLADRVRFEIACRVNEAPGWLGSTYSHADGVFMVAPTAGPITAPATVQWAYSFGAAGLAACDRSGIWSDSR